MPSVIGQLLVELGVNMGAFEQGLSKATYQTKKFGKDLERTFDGLSRNVAAVAGAFGAFGPEGAELIAVLTEAGSAAGAAIEHFSGTSKVLGVFAGAAAGAAAAALSLAGATVTIAAHTAKEMKDMGELARATGTTTEAFTALAFAAKQAESDIDPETLAKGLERLGRESFDAAEGNTRLQAAFSQLGVSIRDSNGKMRSTLDLLFQISDRFKTMPDGPAKTGLAMQIFSRGGAQMIALLNMGSERIKTFMEDAKALGVAFNDEAAEGAANFVQSLNFLEAAGQGVSNQLTSQLAPVLAQVADEIMDSFKSNNSAAKDFITGLADVVKGVIDVGVVAVNVFEEIGHEIELVARLAVDAGHIMSNGWKDTVGLMKADFSNFADQSVNQIFNVVDFLKGKTSGSAEASGLGKKNLLSDIAPQSIVPPLTAEADTAKEFIEKTRAAADEQDKITAAINGTTAAIAVQKAIAQANNEITQQRLALQTRLAELEGRLSQKSLGLSDQARANYQKQADQIKSYLTELADAEGSVVESVVRKSIGQTIAQDAEMMAKSSDKYDQQIESLNALADAYAKGDAAVANAKMNEQLNNEAASIDELQKAIGLYVTKVDGTEPHLQAMIAALAQLKGQYADLQKKVQAVSFAEINAELKKQENDLRDQATEYAILAAAADKSRGVQVSAAAEVAAMKLKAQGGTVGQQNQQYNLELEKQQQEYNLTVARKGAELDLANAYQTQLDELQDVTTVYKGNAVVQLTAAAQLYDLQNKTNDEWDKAALKVGDLTDRFHAFFDEIRLGGQDFAQGFFEDITKALDGVNQGLVQLTVTGKASFKSVREGLESSLLNTGLKKLESTGAGEFEKLFGIHSGSAKPDGTKNNPFYMLPANGILSAAGLGGTLAKGALPSGGFNFSGLSTLFGGGASGGGASSESLGGFITRGVGLFSKIFSAFGGFLADGGSVTPGKTYVVGEKHPEFFTPGVSGQVAPTIKTGGSPTMINANLHLHGVTDADSFKKNQNQIMTTFTHGLGQAARRR